MPELPELEALRIRLQPALDGRMVTGVSINPKKGHLLRYPIQEFERELPVRRFRGVWRRGKHLLFDLALANSQDRHLVINPMLGGRFQIAKADSAPPGTWIFSLRMEGGEELRYLDFKDMGRIYWAQDLAREIPNWNELGPEADGVGAEGLESFRRRLRRYRDELKDLLRNQAFMAGIGNAYSDEILFEARLLPLRRRATLRPADEEALFTAIPSVLAGAVKAILANPTYQESKQDRSFMAVHAKGGQPCPRCGHRITQLGTAREPLNFCRGCQV